MIKGMDKKIFKAAEDGNIDELLTHVQGSLSLIRTPAGDSVLQVHARVSERPANTAFMDTIIAREPSLLSARNDAEETPLHTAAKSGQHDAIKLFLDRGGGSYTTMVNKEGDTALHIASREGFPLVVKELLCGNHMADQEYAYTANHAGETPLHLAVEKMSSEIIDLIIENIPASEHGHSSLGSALHAAVLLNNSGILAKIMEMNPTLIKFQDSRGQTSLHYAAKYWFEGLRLLLMRDSWAVYCEDKEGRTVAHIATQHNNVRGLQLLVDYHPDCCEKADNKGQNVVHYAASLGRGEVLKYFLEDRHFNNLIYQKDINGDTPFHLLADSIEKLPQASVTFLERNVIPLLKLRMKPVFDKHNRTPGDIAARYILPQLDPSYQDFVRKFVAIAPTSSRNKNLQEPSLLKSEIAEEERKKVATKVKKTANKLVILSVLVAGASYQAGISVPGGFNQDDTDPVNGGTSILVNKSSFQAFVVFNTISFMTSIIATFLYSLVGLGNGRGIWKAVFACAFLVTSISLATFVLSFMASLYSTTWKSGISVITLYLAFCSYLLCYALFVRGVVVFMRERSKLIHSIV